MIKVPALILAVAVFCACSNPGSVDSTSQPDTSTTVSSSTTPLEPVAEVLQVDVPSSMSNAGFSQSTATVAGGETTVELGGASITVPSGSATEGAAVSLSIFDAPPDDVDVELRASTLPGPVDFTIHTDLTGPVSISIPVAEGVSEPMMIWFDPEADMWLPVPDTSFDPERRLVSASIDHLTLFDVIDAVGRSVSSAVDWTVDRAVGGLSWVSYQTANVFGNRADPPSCSGELPGWVETVNVVDDRNAALFACGEADGDRLVVKVVANRGYSMSLTSTVPFTASPVASTAVGAAAGYAFQQALGSADPSAGYVAAQSQALLVFNRPESLPDGGLVEIQGTLDGWSVLGDVAVKAFGASSLPHADLVELFECGVAAVEESESVDLSGFDSVSEAVSVWPPAWR